MSNQDYYSGGQQPYYPPQGAFSSASTRRLGAVDIGNTQAPLQARAVIIPSNHSRLMEEEGILSSNTDSSRTVDSPTSRNRPRRQYTCKSLSWHDPLAELIWSCSPDNSQRKKVVEATTAAPA